MTLLQGKVLSEWLERNQNITGCIFLSLDSNDFELRLRVTKDGITEYIRIKIPIDEIKNEIDC